MEINVMDKFTPIQRAQIVELYIKNNHSIVLTQREFRRVNGVRIKPLFFVCLKSFEAVAILAINQDQVDHAQFEIDATSIV